MKKLWTLCLLAACIITLAACGKMEKAFDAYLPERDAFIEKDLALVERMEKEFFEEEDAEKSLKVLQDVLPEFEKQLKQAGKIKPQTEELKEIHALYLEGMEKNLKALHQYEQALNGGSEDLFASGDELMDQSYTLFEQADNDLVKLAEDNGIELELE